MPMTEKEWKDHVKSIPKDKLKRILENYDTYYCRDCTNIFTDEPYDYTEKEIRCPICDSYNWQID